MASTHQLAGPVPACEQSGASSRSATRRLCAHLLVSAAVVAGSILSVTGPTAPRARADVVPMPAQHYTKVSRDGWTLSIDIDGETVNSVPNLAAAVNSREGFVTLSATATATGGSTPITDSVFITGYQLGCQSDVSSGLGIGGAGAVGPSAALSAGGPSVGIAGGITGFVQTTLQPGVIVDVPMANMALGPDGRAMLDIDNVHIKADACGGDVHVRSYAYLRISTAMAHTEFAIYGDPAKI